MQGLILSLMLLSLSINAGETESKNSGMRFVLLKCGMPILPYGWTEARPVVPVTISFLGFGFHKKNLFVGTYGYSVFAADCVPDFISGVYINIPLVIKYEHRLKDNYYAYGLGEISLYQMISKERDDECISFSLGIVKKVYWTELGLNFRITRYLQYDDGFNLNPWWFSLDVVYLIGRWDIKK